MCAFNWKPLQKLGLASGFNPFEKYQSIWNHPFRVGRGEKSQKYVFNHQGLMILHPLKDLL